MRRSDNGLQDNLFKLKGMVGILRGNGRMESLAERLLSTKRVVGLPLMVKVEDAIAAINEALEEAAKVADAEGKHWSKIANRACQSAANEIRALK